MSSWKEMNTVIWVQQHFHHIFFIWKRFKIWFIGFETFQKQWSQFSLGLNIFIYAYLHWPGESQLPCSSLHPRLQIAWNRNEKKKKTLKLKWKQNYHQQIFRYILFKFNSLIESIPLLILPFSQLAPCHPLKHTLFPRSPQV